MKKQLTIKVIILSIMHLIVDGICAYTVINDLYNTTNSLTIILVFIGYNGLAFLTQPLVGILIDKKQKEKLFLNISLVILILGALLPINWIIRTCLIGMGNSIFHVVGGKYTVKLTKEKLTPLGLFVSLGAIGIVLGTYIYQKELLAIFVVGLALFSIILLFIKDEEKLIQKEPLPSLKDIDVTSIMLIAIVVLIRAIMGKVALPLFKTNYEILIWIGVMVSLGKIIGGILADLFGIKITTIVTLTLSLIGYFFFRDNLYMYMISTVLFNTTMPITLFLSNKCLPNREGFSFGILAFMLFPGYLLGELYLKLNLSFIPLLLVSVVLSIMIILHILKKKKTKGIVA